MTVKEFYEKLGGNYEEVVKRLMKEERVVKYLNKFLDNTDLDNLDNFLEEKNYPEAFRTVHSIKGVALNLNLDPLAEVSSVLCEELRNGEPQVDISNMLVDVKEKYKETKELIEEFVNSQV